MRYLPKNVKDRTRGLGGSDAGAIFGVNPHQSLPQLWLQKTGKLPPDTREATEPMEWGTDFEDTVAKRFAKKTKRLIRRVNRTIVHPTNDFMLANVDRLQWKRKTMGVLEIKCTLLGNLKAWSAGGIPARFYLQLQHYLAVTGCQWGSFAVLFGGNRLVEFDVPRDEQLITVMIERERQFWELVQKKKLPPIQLTKEWNAAIVNFFPTGSKTEERQLKTPQAIGKARRYLSLKAQIRKREDELEEHEVFFKSAIGEAYRLIVPGVARFTWSSFMRSHTDLQKLRAEHPEIVEEITSSVPSRRFSVTALEDVREEEDREEEQARPIFGARLIELD